MNHWESFGCFFRSIQPLPSPCHFKKKIFNLGPLFFYPKKNGQSGYIFYQTLRPPLLLGLQIHTTWQWGCFFWFNRSGTANVLMTFFTPPQKKRKDENSFSKHLHRHQKGHPTTPKQKKNISPSWKILPNKMWSTKISHPHSKRKKTKYINYKK